MNPAEIALKKRTIVFVLSGLIAVAGIITYLQLGRLEYPDFVIKIAVVTTPYPGASPSEVEEEVTDVVEEAIQAMGQLDEIWSVSQEGLSVVYAEMKPDFTASELPQIWDELRNKVHDCQSQLPPGAGPSMVNDDFGDVYGLFYGLTKSFPADEYTAGDYDDLKEYAEDLKTELLLCQDVKRVALWGVQPEVVYIELKQSKLAKLGMAPEMIFGVLQSQNLVSPSGKVRIADRYVRIAPTGEFPTEEAIGDLIIGDLKEGKSQVHLRDIADIRRGYLDPPRTLMRLNGKPAIALGISTVEGGNAVTMAEAIGTRLEELKPLRPDDIEMQEISNQGETVNRAVNSFMVNLVESVSIVIILLMIFMGWRSGLLIGVVLILTILATFIYMWIFDITLQKISLGALILALGMLVDNAIVVAEGILVNVQRGMNREEAAVKTVRQTQWPLFGATLIAILAFMAIGFAPGNVGEFCRSLFWVLMASLFFSWIFAVTLTPVLSVMFLQIPDTKSDDPFDNHFFRGYVRMLHGVLKAWPVSLAAIIAILGISIWAFGLIPDYFFGKSEEPRFYVDYWRPQGSHIEKTSEDLKKIEAFLLGHEEVEQVATFIGQGTLRFVLPYDAKDPNTAFGQLLVRMKKREQIDMMEEKLNRFFKENFPDSEPMMIRFANGPPVTYRIEARFRGPDSMVLHELVEEAKAIMREHDAIDVSDDWRQPVQVMRPVFAESVARKTGVARSDVLHALHTVYNGMTIGVYREQDELLPIIVRPPKDERDTYQDIANVHVWSGPLERTLPLEQVLQNTQNSKWEDAMIKRRQRERTITARCNPRVGLASPLLAELMPEIEKIDLPEGYTLEWGGEYEESNEGKEPLAVMFPFCLLGMFVLLIMQFNAIRQPVIIFLCVPLSIIGVTAGLLVTNLAFGFMAILGFLGLSGMLIKNAIILIDQIEIDRKTQENPYHAILSAAASRLRPVVLASGTTVLGMTPLIWDPFYASMAATIAGGLIIGTALTLIVEPLFYMLFFRITPTGLPKKEKGTDRDDGEGEKKQVEDASSGASLEEEDAVDNVRQEKKEEKNDDQSSSEESS